MNSVCRIFMIQLIVVSTAFSVDTTQRLTSVNWGILSTAKINDTFISGLRKSGRSSVVAVASRSIDRARTYAQKQNIQKAYGSYEELLADPEVDVVYISLPNTLHAQWCIKAAEAKKHVLCEKPIALTMQEIDAIQKAAQENNVTIFEGFAYLHHPQMVQIMEHIKAKKLGILNHLSVCLSMTEEPDNIVWQPELGGGALWDLAVYCNSFITTVNQGELPVEVFAQTAMSETGVDSSITAQLKFKEGFTAHITSSLNTPFRQGAELIGSQAYITIPDPWRPGWDGQESSFSVVRDGGQEKITSQPVDPFLCEVQAMERCILEDAQPIVSLNESRKFLCLSLALRKSALLKEKIVIENQEL